MRGTMRALVANMVDGVTKGFEKRLTLVGVGYRAQAQGDKLNLHARLLAPGRARHADGRQGGDADADRDRDQGRRPPAGRPGRRRGARLSVRPSRTRARACATPDENVGAERDEEEVRRASTMMSSKKAQRLRRSRQTRAPHRAARRAARLTVHRTNLHIYAQVISATASKVLARPPPPRRTCARATRTAPARAATPPAAGGKRIAEKAKAAGVETVAFDRAGFALPRPRQGAGRRRPRRRAASSKRTRKHHGKNSTSARRLGRSTSDGLREKMIAVNRVTKVVKGGRILGFAALTVVGDGDGRIGMGKGKAKRSAGGGAEGDGRGAPQHGQGAAAQRHDPPQRARASTAPRGADAPAAGAPASSPAARCARCSR